MCKIIFLSYFGFKGQVLVTAFYLMWKRFISVETVKIYNHVSRECFQILPGVRMGNKEGIGTSRNTLI